MAPGGGGDSQTLPLIFVTVGTDHHPFDRLMAWVDGWLEGGGADRARCLVQSGTSRPPRMAPWHPYLSAADMRRVLGEASCVVCHGGPSSIIETGRHGLRPIVVPRQRDLGEHVDDHQVAFVRWIADRQEILVATSEVRFRALLDAAISDPASVRASSAAVEPGPAIVRIERWIDELVNRRRSPRTGIGTWVARRLRSRPGP